MLCAFAPTLKNLLAYHFFYCSFISNVNFCAWSPFLTPGYDLVFE